MQKFDVQSKKQEANFVYYTNRTKKSMEKIKIKTLGCPESVSPMGGVGCMVRRIYFKLRL